VDPPKFLEGVSIRLPSGRPPGTEYLLDSLTLAKESSKEEGETLSRPFFARQRVIHGFLNGDISRKHTYASTYVVFEEVRPG
jgi:hypothetical protein